MSSTNLPAPEGSPVTVESETAPSEPGPAPTPEADPTSPATTEPDPVAAAAVDLAREAAEEIAETGTVGEHLGVTLDAGGLTMHSFRCTARGYRGWRWAVTLAHLPDSDRVTVCDTVLLPGAESVLAPDWVPWSARLAPGDLGPGDDLPYRPDDPLLVPGYTVTDEEDADQRLFWEFGLGRERVVGIDGLRAAAARWERGPHGPTAPTAVQASAACVTCAYLVPVSGFLRGHFGICANEWSPADGSVVAMDFGCGAHSETDLELPAPEPLPAHILDDTVIDPIDTTPAPEEIPAEDTAVEDAATEAPAAEVIAAEAIAAEEAPVEAGEGIPEAAPASEAVPGGTDAPADQPDQVDQVALIGNSVEAEESASVEDVEAPATDDVLATGDVPVTGGDAPNAVQTQAEAAPSSGDVTQAGDEARTTGAPTQP